MLAFLSNVYSFLDYKPQEQLRVINRYCRNMKMYNLTETSGRVRTGYNLHLFTFTLIEYGQKERPILA